MTEHKRQSPVIHHVRTLALAVAGSAALAGCDLPAPGTVRVMGQVEYADAFATARETMAQHFSVLSADPDTGQIVCRPKLIEGRPERLLGGSPARQIASLRLRREDNLVVAQVSVKIEREGSGVHSTRIGYQENYNEVPNKTPADETAATTAEQNQTWQTEGYDHATERLILEDIYNSLHPQAKPQ